MLSIEFLIYEHGNKTIGEEALKVREYTYEELFTELGSCDGMIRIAPQGSLSPHGNLLVQLEDELPALVKNLCFEANKELRETGQSVYYFESYPGEVHLTREDQLVRMEGGAIATAYYEFSQFTEELYRCGNRFIELMQRIKGANEESEKDRLSLIQILESTKRDMNNQPPYKTR